MGGRPCRAVPAGGRRRVPDSADLKLIAHAMASGATVVTREQPAPDSKKKIKIPDACNAFGVNWTDPFSLYRTLGMRLVA